MKRLFSVLAVTLVVALAVGCAARMANNPAEWKFGEVTVFSHGYASPEGPTMDKDGNLYFVEYGNGNVDKVTPDGTSTVIATIGIQNNGLIIDKDGNLYVGDWKGKTVYKRTPGGDVSIVTQKTATGDSLRGPNDFAWFKNGWLFMNDPKGSGADNPIGLIHYFDKDMKIHSFDNGLCYPNGLAFSPDYKYLYVGETYFSRITRYEMNSDGTFKSKGTFFYMGDKVWPDGMKCDALGNLWIAAYSESQVWCVNPQGERVAVLDLPSDKCSPSNILFDTRDPYTAYVTAGLGRDGVVYKTRMPVPGMRLLP
jgi:sugar lactone lactonase YvrE